MENKSNIPAKSQKYFSDAVLIEVIRGLKDIAIKYIDKKFTYGGN